MRGAVFTGGRQVALREFPMPEPGEGEVVVAIRASGMCGSDLHRYRSEPSSATNPGGIIAGHEPAGVVHSVGPGQTTSGVEVGQRVMVHHYRGCGWCDHCRTGWTQMCSGAPLCVFGTHAHGSHAPYMRVPSSALVPLDPRLSFEAGAAIGCGTGTAWGALDRLGDIGGATLAVFGQGPVGASATMLATARGARVVALDTEPTRLQAARTFGAVATVNPADTPPADALRDLTNGDGVPLVLETSGASAAISSGIDALARWGRMCLVGLGGEVRFPVLGPHLRQITLMTAVSLSVVQQRRCAQFVVDHDVPVDGLYSERWSLDDVEQAYRSFDKQSSGKGVFVFDAAR